jgi:hypothetical protein
MKFFLFSILSLLLFNSCHDLKKQKQIEKMDTLIFSISEISQELKEIDSVKMEMISREIITIRSTIQENYQNDTLSVELGQELEDFKLAGKQALWVKGNLLIALKTSVETQNRLSQLRADVVAGNGEREKYDSYIKKEETQVADLRKLNQSLAINSQEAIQKHQELNIKMVEYSKSLILKNSIL